MTANDQAGVLSDEELDSFRTTITEHPTVLFDATEAASLIATIDAQAKTIAGQREWRPIETALKDGTPVLLKVRSSIPGKLSSNVESLQGLVFVGVNTSAQMGNGTYDYGWSFRAPVGYGGIPDVWLEGWLPCPDADSFRVPLPTPPAAGGS